MRGGRQSPPLQQRPPPLFLLLLLLLFFFAAGARAVGSYKILPARTTAFGSPGFIFHVFEVQESAYGYGQSLYFTWTNADFAATDDGVRPKVDAKVPVCSQKAGGGENDPPASVVWDCSASQTVLSWGPSSRLGRVEGSALKSWEAKATEWSWIRAARNPFGRTPFRIEYSKGGPPRFSAPLDWVPAYARGLADARATGGLPPFQPFLYLLSPTSKDPPACTVFGPGYAHQTRNELRVTPVGLKQLMRTYPIEPVTRWLGLGTGKKGELAAGGQKPDAYSPAAYANRQRGYCEVAGEAVPLQLYWKYGGGGAGTVGNVLGCAGEHRLDPALSSGGTPAWNDRDAHFCIKDPTQTEGRCALRFKFNYTFGSL